MFFLAPLLAAIVPALLPALVKKVLPTVIMNAENTMPTAPGAEKKEWVLEFFHDLRDVLKAKGLLTSKWDAAFDAVLPKLSDWIEAAIEKLKTKGAL